MDMASVTFSDIEEIFGAGAALEDFEHEEDGTWFKVFDEQYLVRDGAVWHYVPQTATFEVDMDATDWMREKGLI